MLIVNDTVAVGKSGEEIIFKWKHGEKVLNLNDLELAWEKMEYMKCGLEKLHNKVEWFSC